MDLIYTSLKILHTLFSSWAGLSSLLNHRLFKSGLFLGMLSISSTGFDTNLWYSSVSEVSRAVKGRREKNVVVSCSQALAPVRLGLTSGSAIEAWDKFHRLSMPPFLYL